MRVCYYITSHGYGHAVRSAAICRCFPREVELVFRTVVPRAFFEEEVRRPFEYAPAEFDCGCIQSDSITVDVAATAATYRRIAERNRGLLSAETRWLRDRRIDGVVVDMPPFALEAADEAGVPSAVATNFTWYHIYREYVNRVPSFAPYVEEVRRQYCRAGLLLEAEPAMPMDMFVGPDRRPVPLIGREGVNRREDIVRTFGLDPGKRIGLIYTGTFGMDRAPWSDLERFGDWEFLGLLPLPVTPANYRLVAKSQFRYQDLSASADAIISKIGYGTFAESLLHGVPLLYVPRTDFAEFPVLEEAVRRWGHGYRMEQDDFYALRWDTALASASRTVRPQPRANEGAGVCARAFVEFFAAAHR